jgi:glycosyltransferase involved in cell wall biosynthesis
LKKFRVDSHKQCKYFGSTNIIVNSINVAAKKLDLYSDKPGDFVFYYDTLADDHGEKADAMYVAYELTFPQLLIQRLAGRPVLGLSKENAMFATLAGYPPHLVHYVSMGVDTDVWRYTTKKYKKDKFVFLSFCESNTRSGFDILIPAFCQAFQGNKGVELLIKDREATDQFKAYVRSMAEAHNVTIIHEDQHITNFEDQLRYYESADVHICLNRSHTWGMVMSQGMSCGIPTITQRYSGPSDYCTSINSLSVDFDLEEVDNSLIQYLTTIGLKNHLIPVTDDQYPSNKPFWSRPRFDSVKLKMLELANTNKIILSEYSLLARQTALWFSWEKTALNLSYSIDAIQRAKPEKVLLRYES